MPVKQPNFTTQWTTKQEQSKPTVKRRKEIRKMTGEINEREIKKPVEKINKPKGFLKRLTELTKLF